MSKNAPLKQSKSVNILLIVGILFIAINLRPALASVGPLIEDIRRATGLSNGLLGLLTTLPLVAFSVVSTLTPLFTRRFGIEGTLFGAMALLTFGIAIRYINWIPSLYFGTLLAGVAIAFGNVLLPGLTKRNFESKSGYVTSLYSGTMAIGASIAAGVSVPLAYDFGLGWRGSIAIWSVLSFVALLVWVPQLSRLEKLKSSQSYLVTMKKLGSSSLAWKVAIFMGLQSLTFYVILAWLPSVLQSRGYDDHFSGWMLSLSQTIGIFGSLLVPIIAGKMKDQRGIVWFLFLGEVIALLGLILPQIGGVAFWVSLLGFVLGGTFGLSLLFIVLRSSSSQSATELSGMVQSIGYFIAGTGPLIFGLLFDLKGSWTYPFIYLFAIALLKLLAGVGAGKAGSSAV